MYNLKSACKEAGWVFGLSRLLILLITYIGIVLFPLNGQSSPVNCSVSLRPCLLAWYHFDAVAYVNIAHHGYTYVPDTAFFPFWPLMEHFGGLLLGGFFPSSYYVAGVLLANICFYFALVLLYCLLAEDFEPTLARRALFYFALAPYALFFFAGYTESLFVLLSVGFFLLLRRGRPLDWWLAGLLGFVVALTRSSGIILVIPYLVMYIQRHWTRTERTQRSWVQKLNAFVPVVLIPAGIAAYMIYLYYVKGNPFIFISQEATFHWHRYFTFPWIGFVSAINSVLTTPGFSASHLQNLLDLSFTLIPLAALAIGWRRIPLHYALFALGLMLFTLSFPQSMEPLASQARYMMSIFPLAIIFAFWGKRPHFDQLIIILSLSLLAVNIILFIGHYWVA
ncbi:MAG TPA: mannosyltransferase family protein [Ktedonobacteraceae bacterium]|nr:mannosyltransferase family protein [Ktedonobacteraceae bacterium]